MAAPNRNPVAQGGMWQTPAANYSAGTQQLLKQMMKESKLTNFQQRHLSKTLEGGKTLPRECNPTTSAPRRRPGPPPRKVEQKIVDPRTYNPVIRTKEDIESAGGYDREQFAPMPMAKYGGYYEKEKARLSNMMAYGEDLPPPDLQKALQRLNPDAGHKTIDRFDELLAEIEERRKFQDEMDSLGHGGKYRTVVETEISQLIREMEVLDQKRTRQLEARIAREDSNKAKGLPHAQVH